MQEHHFEGYEAVASLGEGNFGPVYSARQKTDGELVAIKTLMTEGEESYSAQLKTIHNMMQLGHAHVASYTKYFKTAEVAFGMEVKKLHIVTHLSGCRLDEHLAANGVLTCGLTLRLLRDIGAALNHMHSNGLIHRGISPQNILMNRGVGFMLADLGLCNDAVPFFQAPRPPSSTSRTNKVDMWALGVTVCCAILEADDRSTLKYLHENYDLAMRELKAALEELQNPILRTLPLQLLSLNPSDRPTATQILEICGEGRKVPLLVHAVSGDEVERNAKIIIDEGAWVDEILWAAEKEFKDMGKACDAEVQNKDGVYVKADGATVFEDTAVVRVTFLEKTSS